MHAYNFDHNKHTLKKTHASKLTFKVAYWFHHNFIDYSVLNMQMSFVYA